MRIQADGETPSGCHRLAPFTALLRSVPSSRPADGRAAGRLRGPQTRRNNAGRLGGSRGAKEDRRGWGAAGGAGGKTPGGPPKLRDGASRETSHNRGDAGASAGEGTRWDDDPAIAVP